MVRKHLVALDMTSVASYMDTCSSGHDNVRAISRANTCQRAQEFVQVSQHQIINHDILEVFVRLIQSQTRAEKLHFLLIQSFETIFEAWLLDNIRGSLHMCV